MQGELYAAFNFKMTHSLISGVVELFDVQWVPFFPKAIICKILDTCCIFDTQELFLLCFYAALRNQTVKSIMRLSSVRLCNDGSFYI